MFSVLKRTGHCTEWCAKSLYTQFVGVRFTVDRGPNASAGGKLNFKNLLI